MDSKNFPSNSAQSQNFLNLNTPDNKLLDAKLILENEKISAPTVSFKHSQEPSITIIKTNLHDKNLEFSRYKKQYQRNIIYNLFILLTFIVLIFVAYFLIFKIEKYIIIMKIMILFCLLINLGFIGYNLLKMHFESRRMNDIIRTNVLFGFLYLIVWVVVNLGELNRYNLSINSN